MSSVIVAKAKRKCKVSGKQEEALHFMYTENSATRSLRELNTATDDCSRFLIATSTTVEDLSSKNKEVKEDAEFCLPLILNRLTKSQEKEAVAARVFNSKDDTVELTRSEHKQIKYLLKKRSTLKAKDRLNIDEKLAQLFSKAS